MKIKLLAAAAVLVGSTGTAYAGGHSAYNPIGELPNAQAGQCFARIVIPAEYEKVAETVVVEEAHERLSAMAPEFGPSSIEVKIKDEGVQYVVRQPVYEMTTEQVMVKPGHERLVITPAQFENVTEVITIGEARQVWKAGSNLSSHRKIDEQTGQVYCLVDVPAETRTITRRVLVQPEQVSRVAVNAEYATVQKQILVDRGGVEEIATPAEFKTIATQELMTPAHTASTLTSARTDTIEKTVLRSAERFEWVEVLCDTNAHTSSISDLQMALRDRGYYQGPIDGIIGAQTESAVRQFQSANGLPHQGFVTMETLRLLGLSSGGHVEYQTPHHVEPAKVQQEKRSFQPEIMPHPQTQQFNNTAPIEDGRAIRRDGKQVRFEESRSQSMASEFEAHAAALTGRVAADQMLAQGGVVRGAMNEMNAGHQPTEPLTSQTSFQRPEQYSVRNRLNWDDK